MQRSDRRREMARLQEPHAIQVLSRATVRPRASGTSIDESLDKSQDLLRCRALTNMWGILKNGSSQTQGRSNDRPEHRDEINSKGRVRHFH